jgi:hypothetical protein
VGLMDSGWVKCVVVHSRGSISTVEGASMRVVDHCVGDRMTGILTKYLFPGNDGSRSWYFGAKDVLRVMTGSVLPRTEWNLYL